LLMLLSCWVVVLWTGVRKRSPPAVTPRAWGCVEISEALGLVPDRAPLPVKCER
jgi:hypothetical protein